MSGGAKANNSSSFHSSKPAVGYSPSKDADISQDVHLKMCKKIAQLTKVIYALNTRNDEHESIVAANQQIHEEQLSKVYSETETKIEQYRKKIELLTEKIGKNDISKTVEEHFSKQLQAVKSQAEEKEKRLSLDYAAKLAVKCNEVSTLTEQVSIQLTRIEELKNQWKAMKEQELLALSDRYRLEKEAFEIQQQEKCHQMNMENETAVAKYTANISRLEKELQDSTDSKNQLQKDTDLKLSKMQAFFDKELEALKSSQNVSNEERYRLLERELQQVKQDSAELQANAERRLEEVLNKVSTIDKQKSELLELNKFLEKSVDEKISELSLLTRTLADTRQLASQLESKVTRLEAEMLALRQIFDQQKEDLLAKSSAVSELQASKLQHLATIDDLTRELQSSKQRLIQLEDMTKSLENNQQLRSQEETSKLKSLQQAYQELVQENKQIEEKFKLEMTSVEKRYDELKNQLISSHQSTLDDVTRQHQQQMINAIETAENQLTKVKQELESEMDVVRTSMETEKMKLIENHQQVTGELTDQLTTAKTEIERLEKLLFESQHGLDSASTHAESLRTTANNLSKELETARRQLTVITGQYATLQEEYTKFREKHDTSVEEAERRLRSEIEALTARLNETWSNTLMKDTQKLRTELTEQKESEKSALLKELTKIKEEELLAVTQGWEVKVDELLRQISALKQAATAAATHESELVDQLRRDHSSEVESLRAEMTRAADDYCRQISEMESLSRDQVSLLSAEHVKQLQETSDKLKQQSILDMKAQILAHKAALVKQQEKLERASQEELDSLRQQNELDMESLRSEMELRFADDMEQTSNKFKQQIQTVRMELDRALELAKLKEGEYESIVSDLQDKVRFREKVILELKDERAELQTRQAELSQQLQERDKEIVQVRSDAKRNLRSREGELERLRQIEVANIEADNLQKTQEMLAEFNHAQQILKDKIRQLQNMLEEAEERYQNRESREEDLAVISRLQSAVRDHEAIVKQLTDEKRYFQMELVNRETNFNKVFSGDPKVGLLNPLTVAKKPKLKEASLTRFPSGSSSESRSSRLEPLPGSPLHDEKLNNLKPIPPTKKLFR